MRDNMVQKGVTDIMARLRRQLEECGDEAGRAFLQESIDKINALSKQSNNLKIVGTVLMYKSKV